jgi:hypothetical protein
MDIEKRRARCRGSILQRPQFWRYLDTEMRGTVE